MGSNHREKSRFVRMFLLAETQGRMWCEDFVRELWNRPRSPVQMKYGVFPALSEAERAALRLLPVYFATGSSVCVHLTGRLIRVVPPKLFGPL